MMLSVSEAAELLNTLLDHWLVLLGGLVLVGVILTESIKLVLNNWRRSREAQYNAQQLENEAKLKALMIQRGMPLDEIERVLATGGAARKSRGDDTRLEELMIEQGMEASEIQRVLRARRGAGSSRNNEPSLVEMLVENDYKAEQIEKILKAARVKDEVDDDALHLVRVMAENWMSAEDIERVLRARRAGPTQPAEIKAVLSQAGVDDAKAERVLRAVKDDGASKSA